MILRYKQNHLSIQQFNSISLPDFTILTGVNGSGKSHLLEAIEQNKVIIEDLDNPFIVRFDLESFKLEDEKAFEYSAITKEKNTAWKFIENEIKPRIEKFNPSLNEDYLKWIKECETKNVPFWQLPYKEITNYKKQILKSINDPMPHHIESNKNVLNGIETLIKKLNISIEDLSRETFDNWYIPIEYKNNLLPSQIGKIIWDYYFRLERNEYYLIKNKSGSTNYKCLSENEFYKIHGEKPWNIINRIFNKFNSLPFIINSPEGLDIYGNYSLKIVHTQNQNVEIGFNTLSSGEKVLMALVATVYKASIDHHFPDVLLLDEIDSSLHPSMIQNMLDVIQDIFINKNVKVILVTHSPTTIALSPVKDIYVMNKQGENRIEKKNQQEALLLLTEGYATLDHGLRLFDEISKKKVSIITEGNNTIIIKKALELYGYNDIDIISGAEGRSGKEQLKTLFDFFVRVPHDKKVIFVWDCDVKYSIEESNNTYPFIFNKNTENTIAKKGIENLFNEELFENFKTTIEKSNGEKRVEFDENRKRDFSDLIISRNNKDDFSNFSSLFNHLDDVLKTCGKV